VSYAKTEDVAWRKCKTFRFDYSWARHKEQATIVKKFWRVKHHGPNPWSSFHEKLYCCRIFLKQWVRKHKNPVAIQIQQKMKDLLAVQSDDMVVDP
jgi:hypothetical protein